MNLWEWITTTTSVDSIVSTLGLGVLAVLFATDRILTKGQHDRRVADLVAYHTRELGEMRTSRDYYRQARIEERERADAATAQLGESVEIGRAALQMLQGVDQAARSAGS